MHNTITASVDFIHRDSVFWVIIGNCLKNSKLTFYRKVNINIIIYFDIAKTPKDSHDLYFLNLMILLKKYVYVNGLKYGEYKSVNVNINYTRIQKKCIIPISAFFYQHSFKEEEIKKRNYRYTPLVTYDEYIAYTRKNFLDRTFDGSAQKMLLNFVKEEKISKADLQRLMERF